GAEWFLDNFYLIKDLELQIRHNLPPRYERKLLIVNTGPWQGYPRVFALMVELIEHCDSQLHAEVLRDFINSYQKINPLSSGELWAIPIMLSIALLENIRRLITQALYTIRERQAAACWLRPLSDLENLPEQWEAVLPRRGKPGRFSAPYAARVVEEIRKFGPEAAPLIRWFDQELEAQDASAESLCEIERHRQTAAQVTMGHAITSLRFLAGENWPRFFEEVSAVEKILQTDPAQVYGRMEFSSRDHYRHNVEQIARRFKVSEIDVAQRAIDFSQQAASSAGLPESHVGFFLIGPGRQRLEQVLAARPGNQLIRLTNRGYWSLRDHPQAVYFSLVAGLSALVLYLFVWLAFLPGSGKTGLNLLPFVIAAALLSSLNIGIKLVNWTMTRLVTPTFLPKLQLYDGIPTELRTMVVIPTFLTTVSRIKELVSQLEVYYLANQDANLHFALLTDFPDAKQEHLPGDLELLNTAIGSIKSLNGKYGQDRFFLFHRKRQFNQAEQLWMGWERKRGKLLEFNRLLRNAGPTSYSEKIGDLSILPQIRYVITLDADTQLPRDSAKRLIGTIAHPLHAPVLNNDASRVVAGYGIVQPRISISVENAGASIFARISAGKVGVDPYTTAVSDVYQDLFGEGCFTGKGIYNVEFFDKVTWQAFPENTILSHDLLEGLYARTGLATDIELIDGCPAKYHAHVQRVHRWTRGDWQIIRWLFRPLPLISKWKIIDNLRRSLEAPSQLALILLAFWVLPGGPFIWSGLVVLDIVLPVLLGWLNLASKTENKHTDKIADGFLLVCLQLMFLPYQAYIQLDAIVRSIWRQAVSHRHLLEWEPAAETERRLDCSLRTSWQLMWPAIAFILAYTAALFVINSLRGSQFMALAVLWLLSPWVAYRISRPAPDKEEMLPEDARRDLRHFARQIWAFFEDHVNASENWLPPDNVQIDPPNGVAHRTSPTNVGLALLANLAAREFGYLTLDELFARVGNSLDTVSRLEEWKGHLLNWYDTRTLAPLQPKYVSTVDSGNFVGYLLTLQTGLAKLEETPVLVPTMAEGLLDTVELCLAGLPEDGAEQTGAASRTRLTDFAGTLRDLIEQAAAAGEPAIDVVNWYLTLRKWQGLDHLPDDSEAHFWASRIERMVAGFRQELLFFFPWVRFVGDSDQSAEIENMRKLSALSLNQLARGYEAELEQCSPGLRELLGQAIGVIKSHLATSAQLQKRLEERALATDFKPLYDQERQLFAIGYRVNEHQLDQSYYDLLASEARQASFIAIAKGDISKNHWFRLGRSLTKLNGWRSLVSWSGTMFEFLMPLLVMRSYPGTLLAETYHTVVEVQRQYGKRQNIPWGISESGFYAFDTQLNYQYKAFGVPGLGLKRGLIEDLVIAPYATFLAAMVAPRQAVTNLRQMRSKGFAGRYGLYEAIDFTAERLQAGRDYKVVQSYMAHHQGMSLLALTNTIYRRKLQSLFHSIPMVKA
ncbi:MAG TPA: glucoamylase family protein, partial [Desulfobacteria bacterium]|nr:glucoamylase family protein [Desulfobacteria bacterium]